MNKRIIVIIDEKKVSIRPEDIDRFSSFEEAYKKAITDAYKVANRLIKIRERSKKEIEERLKEKGFYIVEIEEVIKNLLENRIIDDERFSKMLIESYLKKGYGLLTIKRKLKERGIEIPIEEYEDKIENLKERSLEEAKRLAIKKIKNYKEKGLKLTEKIKRYLFQRGFETEIIKNVITFLKENGYLT